MKAILASLCGGQNRAQVVAQSRNVLIGIGAAVDRAPPHWQGSSLDGCMIGPSLAQPGLTPC
jgi:hypothetical protein